MPALTPDLLARHVDFARRLARGLVGDASLAEDVVQETWAAVLERPTSDVQRPRAFLATLLRRAAGRTARAAARRERRERDVARAEALPSAAEQVAAMETHRRVVDAVLALPEPYRRVVMLRFYEDLSAREIAERSGEPVETVRTRLKRGLSRLRAELDESCDGRATWTAALLPLVPTGAPLNAASGGLTGALWMTTQTKLALTAFALLLGVFAWRVLPELGRRERDRDAVVAPTRSEDSVAQAEPGEPSTSRAEVPGSPGRAAVGAAPSEQEDPERDAGAVRGRVVLVDEDGAEQQAADGVFELSPAGRGGEAVAIEVRAGAFELTELAQRDVEVRRLELDGRMAFFEAARHAVPAPGDELILRARWYPPVTLRVLDARTGVDLDGVDVVHGVTIIKNRVHPGDWEPDQQILSGASSPIALPDAHGEAPYWVVAPGYAWRSLRIEHRDGGERVLELEPRAASLVVHLPSIDPDLNLFVRVHPVDGTRRTSGRIAVRANAPRLELHGVAALGEVEVCAEVGHWWDPPLVLGREVVDLPPGSRTEVHLDLDLGPLRNPPARLAGTVRLPASHPDLELDLQLRPASGPPLRTGDRRFLGGIELARVAGNPLLRTFDLGRVTPGSYWIFSTALQFGQRLDVPPSGSPDVVLQLPELGDVLVRVRDERSGELLAVDALDWSGPAAPEVNARALARFRADPDTRSYRFTAPQGSAAIHLSWDEYAEVDRRIDVGPGLQEVELTTRRLPGFWLKLVDGETVVPLAWEVPVEVHAVGTDARGRRRRVEHGRAWVATSAAGPYEVVIGDLRGYREIPPLACEASTDEPEFVVRLRRE